MKTYSETDLFSTMCWIVQKIKTELGTALPRQIYVDALMWHCGAEYAGCEFVSNVTVSLYITVKGKRQKVGWVSGLMVLGKVPMETPAGIEHKDILIDMHFSRETYGNKLKKLQDIVKASRSDGALSVLYDGDNTSITPIFEMNDETVRTDF